jgi:threonine synthase
MAKNAKAVARKDDCPVQRCILPECGAQFGIREALLVCSRCGGPLEVRLNSGALAQRTDLKSLWATRRGSLEPRDRSGVWRFRELLPYEEGTPIVTLGEGNTPLYDAPRCAEYAGLRSLRLKHQGCNPTGSFKDTGMTAAVTQAVLLGAKTVACASTGNTAASLTAYAARAGLQCAILVPRGQITAAKLAQSMDYGAVICEVDGNFDDCMRLIRELAEDPSMYIANSINPFRIEGQKTVAFELVEQCGWKVPDHVVVPGGNMGNSSALGKGFGEMLNFGLIGRLPKLSVVQAEGAAPLARFFAYMNRTGSANASEIPDNLEPVQNPTTLATAIKIGSPVSWRKSLRAVLESGGQIITVSEGEIAEAKAMIGRDGIGCEPASATTVAGIKKLVIAGKIGSDENVVAVLTGHILKDPDYTGNYHRGTLPLEFREGRNAAQRLIEGKFRNPPERVAPKKKAILESLKRRR